jgi:hypothetical protein
LGLRNRQGERRISARLYKLLLTTHIIVSVGWLGVVFAKLALGLATITSSVPEVADALYVAIGVLNVAFPPLAIGTIVSGVLLSLGTKWGLLEHYWVATKLALAVGVITTAVQLGGRIARQPISALSGQEVVDGTLLGITSAPSLLISLSIAHLLMLSAATAISVYKPWGKTWFGRRRTARQQAGGTGRLSRATPELASGRTA